MGRVGTAGVKEGLCGQDSLGQDVDVARSTNDTLNITSADLNLGSESETACCYCSGP